MLDINLFREQPDVVRKSLTDRQLETTPVEDILELDEQRRTLIQEVEALKAEKNIVSKEIAQTKDEGARQAKIDSMRKVGDRISELDRKLRVIESQLNEKMSNIPNIPDQSTPYGISEDENDFPDKL